MLGQLKVEIALIGCIATALLSVQGCSLFSSRSQTSPESTGFRSTAATTSNPVPLPVEIVSDISALASGGQIQQEGVWRPRFNEEGQIVPEKIGVPGEVQRTPAANADPTVAVAEPEGKPEVTSEPQVANESGETPKVAGRKSRGGKSQRYTVRRGDTLMKISFAKYGNIYRWKEIYETNKKVLPKPSALSAGMILTIQGVEYVVIEKNGEPYLIRRGDTLAGISNDVYGTKTEWRSLWKNNRQLIRDPNKIYAGFTLYYVPKGGVPRVTKKNQPVRQVSSERKIEAVQVPVPVQVPVQAPGTMPKPSLVPPPLPALPPTSAPDSGWSQTPPAQ